MKTIVLSNIIFAFILLLAAGILRAADNHAALAMEHAAVAASHGEKGHNKILLNHVQESLRHAMASISVHEVRLKHMMKAQDKLKEAEKHANKDHKELATKATQDALEHIHKAFE